VGSSDVFSLVYRFVDEHPADGFSGWITSTSEREICVDVSAICKDLTGGFLIQALNRPLAQAIIREKPAVIVLSGFWGCTVDLPRLAHMMGVPVIFDVAVGLDSAAQCDRSTLQWIADALGRCDYLIGDLTRFGDGSILETIKAQEQNVTVLPSERLMATLQAYTDKSAPQHSFSYSTYEFVLRDHPLLARMQEADIAHFTGCKHVLDVACGSGIFLDALSRSGIRAEGVERDAVVAEYGRGMGLDITTADAMEFLATTSARFDGIYCSHFVEHLPIDVLEKLIANLHRCLLPGGLLVLVFPDPESIRSQLLGFWRDPEHVRFYHPELVSSLALASGFTQEWSSYEAQPHTVVPFSIEPPALEPLSLMHPPQKKGWIKEGMVEKLMQKIGFTSTASVDQVQQHWQSWAQDVSSTLNAHQAYMETLADTTNTLWQVNNTWAWSDNATLKLKRGMG